jgi:hypothetical protein
MLGVLRWWGREMTDFGSGPRRMPRSHSLPERREYLGRMAGLSIR